MTHPIVVTTVVFLLALAAPGQAQQATPGQNFIDQWDADADGHVTLEEAVTKRGDIFYMFDSDEDGSLNATEWAGVAEHMAADIGGRAESTDPGMAQMMGRGPGMHIHAAMTPEFNDADGDGMVTQAEFTAATERLFPMLDGNGDGLVDLGDFRRN